MAGRGSSTFNKRQKEQRRKEKQREKTERRTQRKMEKAQGSEGAPSYEISEGQEALFAAETDDNRDL